MRANCISRIQNFSSVIKLLAIFQIPDTQATTRISNFRLICDQDLQLGIKFTMKQADRVFQPKIDPNAVNILEINDNCLLKIASYLDLIDIVNLSKTSVRMRSFSKLIFERRTHFSFNRKTGDTDQSFKRQNLPTILQVMGSYIRTIDWRGLKETHLKYLCQFCPNVTELRLVDPSRSLTSSAIKNYTKFFKNIKKLVIVRAAFFDATMKTITSSSNLKHLQLIKCRNIRGNFFSTWKSCRLIHLKICNFSFERMIRISKIGRIKTLKSFSVNKIEINADTMKTLRLYKNLQHLKLENVNNTLERKLYSYLPVRLPKLTTLKMKMEHNDGKINSKSISTMISSFVNLKYFSHSPMSWKLLESVRRARTLQKQAPIEIGIPKKLFRDPKKVNQFLSIYPLKR